jgi:histidyl-tRNA synthetase
MDFTNRSLKAQMTMANRRGASWVLIMGEKELASNQAPLKNMQSGQQQLVSLHGLSDVLAALEAKGV